MIGLLLTIDSFAWIELIRGGQKGSRVYELINTADEPFTPSIVLAEVALRCLCDGLSPDLVRNELKRIEEISKVIPIDGRLAAEGASATEELCARARARGYALPGLGDGLVLATARMTGSRVLTGDRHFEGLKEALWLGST